MEGSRIALRAQAQASGLWRGRRTVGVWISVPSVFSVTLSCGVIFRTIGTVSMLRLIITGNQMSLLALAPSCLSCPTSLRIDKDPAGPGEGVATGL